MRGGGGSHTKSSDFLNFQLVLTGFQPDVDQVGRDVHQVLVDAN